MNPYFFIPQIITYVFISSISATMVHNRYKKRIIAAVICCAYGIVFDVFWPEEGKFVYTALGFLPALHLICYEVLRRILKPWIGDYAYAPSQGDKVGENVKGTGYPFAKTVKPSDYVFGIALLLLPIILTGAAVYFLNKWF